MGLGVVASNGHQASVLTVADTDGQKLGFASCAIWHPGFLDRGDLTRKGESWAKFFGACGLPVSTLAKSMRVYAEQLAAGKRDAKAEDVIENKGIRALAA